MDGEGRSSGRGVRVVVRVERSRELAPALRLAPPSYIRRYAGPQPSAWSRPEGAARTARRPFRERHLRQLASSRRRSMGLCGFGAPRQRTQLFEVPEAQDHWRRQLSRTLPHRKLLVSAHASRSRRSTRRQAYGCVLDGVRVLPAACVRDPQVHEKELQELGVREHLLLRRF